MAVVAGIKIKAKSTKTRNVAFFDEKYTGSEPLWTADAAEWPQEKFDSHLRRSFYYYNYYYTVKSARKHLNDWVKKSGLFTRDEARVFDRIADKFVPMTAVSLTMAHEVGMPFKERHIEFLSSTVKNLIATRRDLNDDQESTEDAPQATALKVSIQDRLAEKTSENIGEIEGQFDNAIRGVKSDFKPHDFLVSRNVPQAQLIKYERVFQARKEEILLAQTKQDAQLVEAYKHYKAADFKRIVAWIDLLLAAIEQYRGVKKATKKARVKKAPTKQKLIAKLKYATDNKELKVVSINPMDIIGSTELWVYNIKTRKIGKYVAAEFKTLSIKGSSIENYDEIKSVCKTVRKPDEKLKEFAKAGKVQLRKFLSEIKAVESRMNGRINTDILLLKVS
jgi:hypothetical protein